MQTVTDQNLDAAVLKLGMTHPIPRKIIRDFIEGKEFIVVMEEWESFLVEMLDEARQEVEKARVAYEAMPEDHPQKAEVQALLEAAQHNSDFVSKAHGVHNLDYAMELLDNATESATRAARIADTSNSKDLSTGT